MKHQLPGLADSEFEEKVRRYHRERIVREALRLAFVVLLLAGAIHLAGRVWHHV